MTLSEIIDRAYNRIGDRGKKMVEPREARVACAYAMRECHKDLKYGYKDVIQFALTPQEPEFPLPSEFLTPTLVLVNGFETEEQALEGAFAGRNFGLSTDGDLNPLVNKYVTPTLAYYFRSAPEGRLIGVSPVGNYRVTMLYSFLPPLVDASDVSDVEVATISPAIGELYVIKTAMEMLDIFASLGNAEKMVTTTAEVLKQFPSGQLQMQNAPSSLSSFKVFMDMSSYKENKKALLQRDYEFELSKVKRLLAPNVKQNPFVYPQRILNTGLNRARPDRWWTY
jgi:hypothetical protein